MPLSQQEEEVITILDKVIDTWSQHTIRVRAGNWRGLQGGTGDQSILSRFVMWTEAFQSLWAT